MKEFRRLLVLVTDTCDSRPAIRRAVNLARMGNVHLTLLDVAEPMAHYLRIYLSEAESARLEAAEERRRTDRLGMLVAEAAREGMAAATRKVTGTLFRAAIQEVLAGGYDLLIKTVDTSEPAQLAVHGALDRHLLRKCPCPVWIEDEKGPEQLRRILVAVNPDPAAPEDHALAVVLLRSAAALAEQHGADLHVIHAWKVPGEWTVQPGAEADPELAPLLGQVMNRHAHQLEEALRAADVPVGQVRLHLVHQRASRAIIAAVQTVAPDLLVLGTLGRTGVPGFFIGNTAERVLSEVHCSVLARKPVGFVSPVTL